MSRLWPPGFFAGVLLLGSAIARAQPLSPEAGTPSLAAGPGPASQSSVPPDDGTPDAAAPPEEAVSPSVAPVPPKVAAPEPTPSPQPEGPITPAAAVDGPPPLSPLSRPRFGRRGQWAILASSTSAGFSSQSFSQSLASFVNGNIAVGVDHFLVDNVSVGMDAEFGFGDNKGYGPNSLTEIVSWQVAGGVRLGVNVPLGSRVSLYPRLTVGVRWDRSDTYPLYPSTGQQTGPAITSSSVGPWTNLYVPLLVEAAPHFVIGVGPRVEHDFLGNHGGPYDGSETTLVGVEFTVGGWWGGPSEDNGSGGSTTPVKPLGVRGQIVLTNATQASVDSLTYSGSSASTLTMSLAPSFDVFVADHLSVGLDVPISLSSGSSATSGTPTSFSNQSLGLALRVGFLLPFRRGGPALWPLVEFGIGVTSDSQGSGLAVNARTANRSWVQVSLPVLVPVAPPFFVGGGPFAFTELTDSDANGNENKQSAFGGNFILGAWF